MTALGALVMWKQSFDCKLTAGSPPVELVMDQEEITPDTYLRQEEEYSRSEANYIISE